MKYAQLRPGPGFAPLHSMLYYSQRMVTNQTARRVCVAALGAAVRLRHGTLTTPAATVPEPDAALQAVRQNGYAPLARLLSKQQCADIVAYLRNKDLIDRQGDAAGFTRENVPDGVSVADYRLSDIVACPHILELANRPSLLALAAHYIGCKPTISGLGMRWSFPTPASGSALQAFHRDSDDWRYLKVLVYITDVTADAGPHVYVRGTHLSKASMRLRFHRDDELQAAYGNRVLTVTGPRGFGFAVDTAGIHKGTLPTRHERLMLQIQYSLLPSYAYCYEPAPYAGLLMLDRYVNRLIVRRCRSAITAPSCSPGDQSSS